MSNLTLTKTRMAHGQWEGRLSGVTKGETPEIEVRLHDQKLDGHDLHEDIATGTWSLVVPIPVDSITDGIQIFTIFDATDDTPLATFHVIAGEPDKKDLRAEVELLRAELDMLKRAFRRHCHETRPPAEG